jgi:hypothetical protein
LLCTATYGCDYLAVRTLKAESNLDEKYDEEYLENRCLESKWADRLMDGGHIVIYDIYDEDEDGKPMRYELTLEDFRKGLIKARDGEDVRDWADFVNENDDYFTCNNLLQVVIFGEVIYG